jgi:hypothetical protein
MAEVTIHKLAKGKVEEGTIKFLKEYLICDFEEANKIITNAKKNIPSNRQIIFTKRAEFIRLATEKGLIVS